MTETLRLPQSTAQLRRLLAAAKAEGRTEDAKRLAMMLFYRRMAATAETLADD